MTYSGMVRKVFLVINTSICVAIAVACLAPLLHIFAVSFSGKNPIIMGEVSFLPKDPTLDNYSYVAREKGFYTAFGVSIVRTVLALVVQLGMTVLAAYPISLGNNRFRCRAFFTWYFLIAVIFSGGLIPTYLTVLRTGLIDKIWALILPGAVPLFNVILMQNFMKALPDEIRESAAIDGAGHWKILIQIILPLCQVSIATISLFIVVGNWNAWYDGMLYINDNTKFPLQTYLRTVIVQPDINQLTDADSLAMAVASSGADAAKIFLALFPIMLVYPFAQKHFVKGIVLGSVKG
jgi:putative aldouronate transport system permease protein